MSNSSINQAITQGRIAAVDNPAGLKSWERDRVHRSVTLQSYVWGFATRSAAYLFLAGSAGMVALLVLARILFDVEATAWETFVTAVATGVFTGGVAGAWALQERGQAFDELAREYEGVGFAEESRPEPEDLVLVDGQPMKKRRRSKKVIFENHEFIFTGRNLDRLLAWHAAGGGGTSIRKERSAAGPGFNALPDPINSSNYTTALYVLKGRGLIDEKNEWTPAGVEFLKQE